MLVLHPLAWCRYPPDVDPINFMMGLRKYDVLGHAPHAPGYPAFVALGRLASLVVAPNRAYPLVNLVLLCGASTLLYLSLRMLRRPFLGVAAAALLVTHPLAWAATVAANSYIADATFTCAVLACGVWLRNRLLSFLLGQALVFLFFGLFRVVTCAVLLPYVFGLAVVLTRCTYRRAVLVVSACVTSAAIAYAITVWLAGGPEVYREATADVMGAAFQRSSVFGGAPLQAHARMVGKLVVWFVVLGAPAFVLSGLALVVRKPSLARDPALRRAAVVGALWIGPPFAFYALVYYLKPTYQLIYLPALLVLLAFALAEGLPRLGNVARAGLIGACALAQVLFFFFGPASLPLPLHRLTFAYVREQDEAWQEFEGELAKVPRDGTLLLWVHHPQLSFYVLRLMSWDGEVAVVSERERLRYVHMDRMRYYVPADADRFGERFQTVALVDDAGGDPHIQMLRGEAAARLTVDSLLRDLPEKPWTP